MNGQEDVAEVLDTAEYLVALLLDQSASVDDFRHHLEDIEKKVPEIKGGLALFDHSD
jgi:hypothetical protein